MVEDELHGTGDESDTPSAIGPYRIRGVIGEGGMGVVYAAEQHSPVRRQVALKMMRPEVASRDVLSRFEAERQALSVMDHPGIARVLDAGVTDDDRPYFVMELVKGVPIDAYSDRFRLTGKTCLMKQVDIRHKRACQRVQTDHIIRDNRITDINQAL